MAIDLASLPRKYQDQAAAALYGAPKNRSPLPHPKPEHHKKAALEPVAEGKEEGVHRTFVRITGLRVNPLDPDNFAGSTKDIIDGLRKAGLLLGDDFWQLRLETAQEKVGSYAEECTVIEIDLP